MSRDIDGIAIGSDHAGLDMKYAITGLLTDQDLRFCDVGTHDSQSVDYPDFADAVAARLAAGEADCGILICGTGIGISIAANRHTHIRAALCHTPTDARLSREHNDANVLVLGARTSGLETALDCVRIFLATAFSGGRHIRRVSKLTPDYSG